MPLELQISTALPLQRYAPAVQETDDEHEPEAHPKLHAVVSSQEPELHVSTLPAVLQRLVPVVHAMQTPDPVQDCPLGQATAVDQSVQPVAFVSHVSTVSPAPQRFAPRVHASVHVSAQTFERHALGLGHAVGTLQSLHPDDFVSHVWMLSPEHCVAPIVVHASVQLTAHTPPEHTVPLGHGSGAESVGHPATLTHSRT